MNTKTEDDPKKDHPEYEDYLKKEVNPQKQRWQ